MSEQPSQKPYDTFRPNGEARNEQASSRVSTDPEKVQADRAHLQKRHEELKSIPLNIQPSERYDLVKERERVELALEAMEDQWRQFGGTEIEDAQRNLDQSGGQNDWLQSSLDKAKNAYASRAEQFNVDSGAEAEPNPEAEQSPEVEPITKVAEQLGAEIDRVNDRVASIDKRIDDLHELIARDRVERPHLYGAPKQKNEQPPADDGSEAVNVTVGPPQARRAARSPRGSTAIERAVTNEDGTQGWETIKPGGSEGAPATPEGVVKLDIDALKSAGLTPEEIAGIQEARQKTAATARETGGDDDTSVPEPAPPTTPAGGSEGDAGDGDEARGKELVPFEDPARGKELVLGAERSQDREQSRRKKFGAFIRRNWRKITAATAVSVVAAGAVGVGSNMDWGDSESSARSEVSADKTSNESEAPASITRVQDEHVPGWDGTGGGFGPSEIPPISRADDEHVPGWDGMGGVRGLDTEEASAGASAEDLEDMLPGWDIEDDGEVYTGDGFEYDESRDLFYSPDKTSRTAFRTPVGGETIEEFHQNMYEGWRTTPGDLVATCAGYDAMIQGGTMVDFDKFHAVETIDAIKSSPEAYEYLYKYCVDITERGLEEAGITSEYGTAGELGISGMGAYILGQDQDGNVTQRVGELTEGDLVALYKNADGDIIGFKMEECDNFGSLIPLENVPYEEEPEEPAEPEVPAVPETPVVPESPETPDVPDTPDEPDTPDTPDTPPTDTPETPPTDTPDEPVTPNPKETEDDINVNPDLPEQVQLGDDRFGPGELQTEDEVTLPPAEYTDPVPEPSPAPAPEATPVDPVEREQEVEDAPVADGANSPVDPGRQEELAESGAGELENGEGNDGRVAP